MIFFKVKLVPFFIEVGLAQIANSVFDVRLRSFYGLLASKLILDSVLLVYFIFVPFLHLSKLLLHLFNFLFSFMKQMLPLRNTINAIKVINLTIIRIIWLIKMQRLSIYIDASISTGVLLSNLFNSLLLEIFMTYSHSSFGIKTQSLEEVNIKIVAFLKHLYKIIR